MCNLVMSKKQGLPKVPVVYLAGGMRGVWHDEVKRMFPGVMFIDPRQHGCGDNEASYTAWDLTGVTLADAIFGYLEASNPAGQGLCVEFGAARALGKVIVYVEEPRDNQRYFGMARAIADEVTDDFYKGLDVLASFIGYALPPKSRGCTTAEYFKANPDITYQRVGWV